MSNLNEAIRLEMLISQAIGNLNFQRSADPIIMLPIAQVRIMRALQHGPQSVTELAESMNSSPSAVSQLISRLVKVGLVQRTENTSDRRVKNLELSARGLEMIQQRHAKRVDNAGRMLLYLQSHEIQALFSLLERLVQNPPKSEMCQKSEEPDDLNQ